MRLPKVGISVFGKSGASGPNGSPSSCTLTVISDTELQVDWTNGATNQDGTKIYCCLTESGTYTLGNTVVGSGTSGSLTGLNVGTLYYVKVIHYKATQLSDYSNTASLLTLTSDAKTYINSLTTPLTSTNKNRINTLIKSLLTGLSVSSMSEAFDIFYVFGNQTEEAALKNIAKRSHDCTLVNSPTFIQYEGYKGGTNEYINPNYNPYTQGIRYTKNSCSLGVYITENIAGTNYNDTGNDVGGTNRNYINVRDNGSAVYGGINSDFIQATIANSTSVGLTMLSRIDSSNVIAYKDGTHSDITATAAANISNASASILQAGNLFSPRRQGLCFWGKGFTLEQLEIIDEAVNFFFSTDLNYYVDEGVDDFLRLQSIINESEIGNTITIGTDIMDKYYLSQPLMLKSDRNYIINGEIKIKNGYTISLIENVPIGQYHIRVSEPEHFSIGQWITIIDDNSEYVRELYFGWGGKIVNIIGDKIYLENPNPYVEFLTNSNARCGHSQGCIILENLDNVMITGIGIINGNRLNQIAVLPYAGLELHGHWEHQRCAMALVIWGCHDTTIGGGLRIKDGLAHSLSISAPFLDGARINERLDIGNIEVSGGHDKNILVRFTDDSTFHNINAHNAAWEDGIIFYSHCSNIVVDEILATYNPRYGFAVNSASGNDTFTITNIETSNNATRTASGLLIGGANIDVDGIIIRDRIGIGGSSLTSNISISNLEIYSTSGIYDNLLGIDISNTVSIDGFIMDDSKSKTSQYAIVVASGALNCSISNGAITDHTGDIISQSSYDRVTWTNVTGLIIT